MGAWNLGEVEVGEALPLGVTTDYDIIGATVEARVQLGAGTVQTFSGVLDPPVGSEIKGALVAIPGTVLSAAGMLQGVVTITKAGQPWSPARERFLAIVKAVI